jgi:MurNAc alpha-1-phosphate uridylyltransferase
MKALILAAGLGTRLREYTQTKPKALVEVNGKAMLELAIEYLITYGIKEIFVNIHHFGDQIIDFLESKNFFNCRIRISDERDVYLILVVL